MNPTHDPRLAARIYQTRFTGADLTGALAGLS